jgi:hypothetical protein
MARKETILSNFHEPRAAGGIVDDNPLGTLQPPLPPERIVSRKIVPETKSESFDVRIKGKRAPKNQK